jgi:arylsulfatase A-like enzyme
VDLDAFAGQVVTLELRSVASTAGGRVLFGDPTLYVPLPEASIPASKLAVIVIMSGLDRSKLANHQKYPAIGDLDRSGTVFEAHRAPTTVSAGVVATLLTGLSPRAHGVEDGGARLSSSVTTLGGAVRDGSVQTAMFSGCPTTFEAFGFSQGWDKYATYSPVEGAPAVAPLTEATRWTVDHMKSPEARALVVIHARGGHPPWDVTLNESAKLPPSEYSGPMEARRAGELTARARARHSKFRLSDNDRTRMWAIYDVALAGQDRALGQFVDALKKSNLWEETLFVVTGDVSSASDSRTPFGEGEELAEPLLGVPLWIHFPGSALAGKRVDSPTGVADIASSVLGSLRLPRPDGFDGIDLFAAASGVEPPAGRPITATLGSRYSLRLGDLILSGTAGKAPVLCQLSSDPSCEVDRLERMPRAVSLLFRLAFEGEVAAQKRRHPREPATIDPSTAAALQVWGE